ncbi:hypothetical protein SNEBB_000883 [Seison nebaliae]|nr:hypothetical protein SNEBB_000883 [Seison nebaliae]
MSDNESSFTSILSFGEIERALEGKKNNVEDKNSGHLDIIKEKNRVINNVRSQLKREKEKCTNLQLIYQQMKNNSKNGAENVRIELKALLEKQRDLESNNLEMRSNIDIFTKMLNDSHLHENDVRGEILEGKYERNENLSIVELLEYRLYEKRWKNEGYLEKMKKEKFDMEQEISRLERMVYMLQSGESVKLDDDRRLLEEEVEKLENRLSLVEKEKELLQEQNRDMIRISLENESLKKEINEKEKQFDLLSDVKQTTTDDKERLKNDYVNICQQNSLLKQEKVEIEKRLIEFKMKYDQLEHKQLSAQNEIDEMRRQKDLLIERNMDGRDSLRVEYEQRLNQQLQELRSQTEIEIRRLSENARETHERELELLRTAMDRVSTDASVARIQEKKERDRADELQQNLQQLITNREEKLSKLETETKMKDFENERSSLIAEEAIREKKRSLVEQDKLMEQLQLLRVEYAKMEVSKERLQSKYDIEIEMLRKQVSETEKLQTELEAVLMQAAEQPSTTSAEALLSQYGNGMALPVGSKALLFRQLQMQRRILSLEKMNTETSKELEREKRKHCEVDKQLETANGILDRARQPYDYLIATVKGKDEIISQHDSIVRQLMEDKRQLEKNNNLLKERIDMMTIDIRRLIELNKEYTSLKSFINAKTIHEENVDVKKFINKKEIISRKQQNIVIPPPTVIKKSSNISFEDFQKLL